MKSESKLFKTDSVDGIKSAERYKARLENKWDVVRVISAGLDKVLIYGEESKP